MDYQMACRSYWLQWLSDGAWNRNKNQIFNKRRYVRVLKTYLMSWNIHLIGILLNERLCNNCSWCCSLLRFVVDSFSLSLCSWSCHVHVRCAHYAPSRFPGSTFSPSWASRPSYFLPLIRPDHLLGRHQDVINILWVIRCTWPYNSDLNSFGLTVFPRRSTIMKSPMPKFLQRPSQTNQHRRGFIRRVCI